MPRCAASRSGLLRESSWRSLALRFRQADAAPRGARWSNPARVASQSPGSTSRSCPIASCGRAGNADGFVSSNFSSSTRAFQNVADGLLYTGVAVHERRERAATALTRVGLGDRLAAGPTQLSAVAPARCDCPRKRSVGRRLCSTNPPATSTAPTASRSWSIDELNREGATIVASHTSTRSPPAAHARSLATAHRRRQPAMMRPSWVGREARCDRDATAEASRSRSRRERRSAHAADAGGTSALGIATASRRSWPFSVFRRPVRPGCSPRSTSSAPTCSQSATARPFGDNAELPLAAPG